MMWSLHRGSFCFFLCMQGQKSFFFPHGILALNFQMLVVVVSSLLSLSCDVRVQKKNARTSFCLGKEQHESRSDLAEYSVFLARIASPSFSVVSSFARDERFSRGRRRAFH